ncbi:heat shock protein beta-3 [Trichomycterus rosablanca]|uniref:heat shock protein beta-3 n=1 Tax=Trichomycterus rosablanca TaxID=2290929 RepID=UPI002F354472
MAGQSVSISHGISCPVRHNQHFVSDDLDKCTEVHHLFALPGLSLPVPRVGTDISDTEDLGEPQFRIILDVTQFRPEDILIQVFEGWLLVRGQHGVRMDEHGFVSRSFTRQYRLPDDQLRVEDLTAMLCHDGILVVETKEKWWTVSD